MNEHPHMKPLGDAAREQAEADVDPELARPFDVAELEALTRGVGARLSPPRRARPVWKPAVFGGATALLAAAGVVLVLHTGSPAAIAPRYDLVVEGGDRATRSADEPRSPVPSVLHVDRGGRIVLIARPRTPGGDAQAATWIDGPAGLIPWSVPVERSAEGAFRIDVRGDALAKLPAGPSHLIVFLADPPNLPRTPATAADARRGAQAGVQTLAQDIDVAP